MEAFAVLALLVLLFAAAAPAVYALRKRMTAERGKLEFWRVLERRGLSAAEAAEEPRKLAVALRRCAFCPSVDECSHWLARGAREGLDEFCPNAWYVRKLEGG